MQVRRQLRHRQVLGRPRALLEIVGVDVADGARHLVEEHVPRRSARLHPGAGWPGRYLQRPHPVDRGAKKTESAQPQQIASRSQQISYFPGLPHWNTSLTQAAVTYANPGLRTACPITDR